MAELKEDQQWRQLVQKLDPSSRLLRAWSVTGGVSAQVTALEIERFDGSTKKWIVRQHGEADRHQNPQIAADEFRLLQILQSAGIAAPAPYYLDSSGEIFSIPLIVMEYVDGTPEYVPADLAHTLRQLAGQLAIIHQLDSSSWNLSFLPDQASRYTRKLREHPLRVDDSLQEGRIREILQSVWRLPQRNKPVLLHGDFWHGNILWKDGQIAAVIDWEDAAVGDPLADLANSRLEILWAFGIDAMREFTQHYRSLNMIDFTDLPYWDLFAALRPAFKIAEWAGDETREKAMREGHRLFVAQALKQLGTL